MDKPSISDIPLLQQFIPRRQFRTMMQLATTSEEAQFFLDKFSELAARIKAMPQTGEQDGKGDDAVVYLHYFGGSCDWWITEKDSDPANESGGHDGQVQAFGFACLGDERNAELGYISIKEIVELDRGIPMLELDLYFQPRPLKDVKHDRYGVRV